MVSFGWFNDYAIGRLSFDLIFKSGLRDAREEVKKLQKLGVIALGGIADTIPDLCYLFCLGLDGIVTNDPELALKVRRHYFKF